MGPAQDSNQDQTGMPGAGMPTDGSAMPPADGAAAPSTPSTWSSTPAASDAGTGMGAMPTTTPDAASMGDETSAAAEPTVPAEPAMPTMPSEPAAPAADGGAAAPQDPTAGMPGATPQ